jgi:hypothetical protein
MTIEVKKPLSVPKINHEKTIPELLLSASDVAMKGNSAEIGLAHIAITAVRLDEKWNVFIVDPENPPHDHENVFGSFIEDQDLDSSQILDVAERWIRYSETTEWVPGPLIRVMDQPEPNFAIGHLLIRSREFPELK